jgi:hypothetical protein
MLIGMMSFPDSAIYVQVHPLVYLTKLNIEMNLAELIGKVVKKSVGSHSLPSADVWRPHLPPCNFNNLDREWLGSAKDFMMPPTSAGKDSSHHRHHVAEEIDLGAVGHPRKFESHPGIDGPNHPAGPTRPTSLGAFGLGSPGTERTEARWELDSQMESGPSDATINTSRSGTRSTTMTSRDGIPQGAADRGNAREPEPDT